MSDLITQRAGYFELSVFEDQKPPRVVLVHRPPGGQIATTLNLGPNDLHDLQYCVDRVMARLKERAA